MMNFSNTSLALIDELRDLFDDDEFVMGVLVYADTESDRRTILDFIRKNDDVTVETVTVLALELDRKKHHN